MHVCRLSNLDELAPYADQWDRLSAGVPFRSWTWLSTWWRHYGQDDSNGRRRRRLYVLCVFDQTNVLIGLAPWYVDRSATAGRVVRPLGSGEVCSDYLSVLCQPGMEDQVTRALADRLTDDAHASAEDIHTHQNGWDLLDLSDFDAKDNVVGRLIEQLADRGNTVYRRAGPNCWRIELPRTWDEYVAMVSKGHRRKLRQLQRSVFAEGRAVLHTIEHFGELPAAVNILVDLHQRRWRSLGEPGCFASPRFDAFHREVMPKLLCGGNLQLRWLELDGRPAAAEYHLIAGGVIYAYQSGIDPELLDEQPGWLITMYTLRRAIEQGFRAFDLLRGDEPYKAHWRAKPCPSLRVRVVPDRLSAQLRNNIWLTGSKVKRWIKGRGARGEVTKTPNPWPQTPGP